MTLGIIVSNCSRSTVVLVADEPYESVDDFWLMPVVTTRFVLKDEQYESISQSQSTKIKVKVTDTLLFGDTITWDHRDVIQTIRNYQRVPSAYESRLMSGESQIKLAGVMSNDRQSFWMLDIWPNLAVPPHLQHSSHPNVVVDAWVTFHLLPGGMIRYELNSFVAISHEFPDNIVAQAPWNKRLIRNISPVIDPVAQDEVGSDKPEVVAPLSPDLENIHGLVMADKQIMALSPHLRQKCFHVVIKAEGHRLPQIGSFIKFSAKYLDYPNIYGVHVFRNNVEQSALDLSGQGNLTTSITSDYDLPGFFFSSRFDIHVDDPLNILESWQLSKYAEDSLDVGLTCGEPSENGAPRLIVNEIVDVRARKLRRLRETGQLRLSSEIAVVLGYRLLHLPRLPKTKISLPGSMSEFGRGSVLRIDAVWTMQDDVGSWKVIVARYDKYIKSVLYRDVTDLFTLDTNVWFHVPNATEFELMPRFVKTDLFGMIERPKLWEIDHRSDRSVLNDFWVTINDCHPGDNIPPQTKFKYAGSAPSLHVKDTFVILDADTFDAPLETRILLAREKYKFPPPTPKETSKKTKNTKAQVSIVSRQDASEFGDTSQFDGNTGTVCVVRKDKLKEDCNDLLSAERKQCELHEGNERTTNDFREGHENGPRAGVAKKNYKPFDEEDDGFA